MGCKCSVHMGVKVSEMVGESPSTSRKVLGRLPREKRGVRTSWAELREENVVVRWSLQTMSVRVQKH